MLQCVKTIAIICMLRNKLQRQCLEYRTKYIVGTKYAFYWERFQKEMTA